VKRLKSGDIVFFVKKPEKRKVGEIIGHIGIIRVEKSQKGGGKGKSLSHSCQRYQREGGMVKRGFIERLSL